MAGKYQVSLSIKDDCYQFVDKKVRAMVLNILRGVVIETPRDQGYASGNWNVTMANPSELFSADKTNRSAAVKDGSIVIQGFSIAKDSAIFVQNHTPYIERLNLGWSKQAGAFFVDKIVKRVVNG